MDTTRVPHQDLSSEDLYSLGWPKVTLGESPIALGVLDDFSSAVFGPSLRLLQPRPDNWRGLAIREDPDLILIESAWQSNGGSWQYRIGSYTFQPGRELEALALWATEQGKPVIFWNKEDPVHYRKFIQAARLADYIFTTDVSLIDTYRAETPARFVDVLLFGAEPSLHHPSPLDGRTERFAFAGSWYRDR